MGPEAKNAKSLDHQTNTKGKLTIQLTTKVAIMEASHLRVETKEVI